MILEDIINKTHCSDCNIFMEALPPECVDLVVTSPPYDSLRTYKGYTFDYKTTANNLYRVLKQGGIVVWIVNDATINGSETGSSFKQALYFKEIGFNLHDTMIWAKPHSAHPSSNRYNQEFEYIFIFSKGKPKTFNPIKDVPTKWIKSFGKASCRLKNGEIKQQECSTIYNKTHMRGNVWRAKTVSQENICQRPPHPAIFPMGLVSDLILSWSNKNDLVYDPFGGSGTTGRCCIRLKRNWIMTEISKDYCEIIEREILDEIQKNTINTKQNSIGEYRRF